MSFDPQSIAQLSMAASAASSAVSARGAVDTGQANADAATYQAAVARNNSTVAQSNAQYALSAGRQSEYAQRQKTAQMIGMQRAQMAANGIDIGSGTPANIQADTASVGEMDALTIRNNAARQAYGYQVQAADFDANAMLLDRTAANAKKAGNMGAFSSIVGGASSVADKWLKWKQPSGANVPVASSADYASNNWVGD